MGRILSIVQGNNFGTAISIHAVDAEGHEIQDFSLEGSTDIRVWYLFAGKEVDVEAWTMEDGKILIVWPKDITLGSYDIFIDGYFESTAWRNAMKSQFRIVKYNYEAYIPDDVIVLNGIYQLSAEMAILTRISGGGGIPSQTIPLMDGVASVGTESAYARGDHRHPSDTSKQDVIADLDAIRSGAAAGATAVQPAALSGYQPLIDNANKLDYSLLDNTPTIPAAQVNSDWNANSGVAQILNKPAIPAAQVQSDWNEADTGSKAYIQNKPTIPAAQVQSDWNEADNTKADYIKNKPTIPAAQVQSDWNEADNTKADYIKNKPTIPSVVDSLSSASTTAALSANQGKALNESKQATIDATHKLSADLVDDTSTTNKFVTALDISAWNGKANKVLVNNHGTDDTTYSVTPNTLHIWGAVASLSISLGTPTDNTIVNEYMIQFESGSTATTLSLPSSVEWAESCGSLSVEASKTYQISIVNNIGLWTAISNS